MLKSIRMNNALNFTKFNCPLQEAGQIFSHLYKRWKKIVKKQVILAAVTIKVLLHPFC